MNEEPPNGSAGAATGAGAGAGGAANAEAPNASDDGFAMNESPNKSFDCTCTITPHIVRSQIVPFSWPFKIRSLLEYQQDHEE